MRRLASNVAGPRPAGCSGSASVAGIGAQGCNQLAGRGPASAGRTGPPIGPRSPGSAAGRHRTRALRTAATPRARRADGHRSTCQPSPAGLLPAAQHLEVAVGDPAGHKGGKTSRTDPSTPASPSRWRLLASDAQIPAPSGYVGGAGRSSRTAEVRHGICRYLLAGECGCGVGLGLRGGSQAPRCISVAASGQLGVGPAGPLARLVPIGSRAGRQCGGGGAPPVAGHPIQVIAGRAESPTERRRSPVAWRRRQGSSETPTGLLGGIRPRPIAPGRGSRQRRRDSPLAHPGVIAPPQPAARPPMARTAAARDRATKLAV